MNRKGVRSDSESTASRDRREFYEHHRVLAILLILVAFFGPVAGVFLSGISGLLLGVAIPAALYYLVPFAANKNRGAGGDRGARPTHARSDKPRC